MKRILLSLSCPLLFTALLMSSCSKETNQNQDKQQLEQLLAHIKAFAESSTCNNDTDHQLKYIAVGAKACGGPTGYLGYSNSINVGDFESLVAKYNELEKRYNRKWEIVSDCAFITPPTSVVCENNKPKLVYDRPALDHTN